MLNILQLVLTLAVAIVAFVRERQMIDAGRAMEVKDAIEDAAARLKRAREARSAALAAPDDSLRDDDGFRRD